MIDELFYCFDWAVVNGRVGNMRACVTGATAVVHVSELGGQLVVGAGAGAGAGHRWELQQVRCVQPLTEMALHDGTLA
jgi:hypothetical protein